MKFIKRFIFSAILLTLCSLLCSCGKSENENQKEARGYIYYSEITAEDWDTIEYVNKNSNYPFTLMEKMDTTKCFQYGDVPNLYGEASENSEVDTQGKKINSEDSIFRYNIILRNPSDYHILGVHQGDTYKDAKEAAEKAGFTWTSESEMYGDRTITLYSKGNVYIRVVTFNSKEDGMDSDEIDTIGVLVPIKDESEQSVDGDY